MVPVWVVFLACSGCRGTQVLWVCEVMQCNSPHPAPWSKFLRNLVSSAWARWASFCTNPYVNTGTPGCSPATASLTPFAHSPIAVAVLPDEGFYLAFLATVDHLLDSPVASLSALHWAPVIPFWIRSEPQPQKGAILPSLPFLKYIPSVSAYLLVCHTLLILYIKHFLFKLQLSD